MGGFVESPSTEEISGLARKARLPFIEDLGSGAVVATEKIAGLEHEPTPAEVLRRGVDLVTFSGDKLFGGPQAGIIAGKGKLVADLKREPFFRALRCDKLILTVLQETVDLYLRGGESGKFIPILEMLDVAVGDLQKRATQIVEALGDLPMMASVGRGEGQIGGGTLPRSKVESATVDLLPKDCSLAELAARLRAATPPVIGYVSGGRLKLDLRTVLSRQDEELISAVRQVQRG